MVLARAALLFFVAVAAAAPAPAPTYLADVSQLNAQERFWVDWIKKWTVPNTRRPSGDAWSAGSWPQVTTNAAVTKPGAWAAAIGTWWSLSEGIFDETADRWTPLGVPNGAGFVFSYNLCTGTVKGLLQSNAPIGPNEKCPADYKNCKYGNPPGGNSCWQNGIFGMEMSHLGDEPAVNVATAAENIYSKLYGSGYTYLKVIQGTLANAGYSTTSAVYKDVMKCFPNGVSVNSRKLSARCSDLVSIWLVRNHLVGLAFAVNDNLGCLKRPTDGYPTWCHAESSTNKFGTTFDDVKKTINTLAVYFNS